jgi:predicted phosphate transport protein (TIGR00153 family)
MFNLLPKDTVFYDLFEGLSRRCVTCAELLHKLAQEVPNYDSIIQRIRDEEHAADDLAHQALDRLDRTFITPFDREDIHTLVQNLDDVIDNIDAVAKRFPLYHIDKMEPSFLKQTEVLVQATAAVNQTVLRLRKSRKLSDLSDLLIEIHRLESLGDDNNHAAISHFYSGQFDALTVMKWKELFDMVESAIDGCEDTGNTLERIVLKNG